MISTPLRKVVSRNGQVLSIYNIDTDAMLGDREPTRAWLCRYVNNLLRFLA